jgi:hypothetical protein
MMSDLSGRHPPGGDKVILNSIRRFMRDLGAVSPTGVARITTRTTTRNHSAGRGAKL